jgi:hypothetical protein
MRRTDLDLDAQASPKADQSGWKITARWTPNPARVAIQGDPFRSPILRQCGCQGFQCRFRREIGTDMGIEQDRGPRVNDIERLDHVLSLPARISGDTTDIGCQSICQQVMGAGRSSG